jgi:hypothetical protein
MTWRRSGATPKRKLQLAIIYEIAPLARNQIVSGPGNSISAQLIKA